MDPNNIINSRVQTHSGRVSGRLRRQREKQDHLQNAASVSQEITTGVGWTDGVAGQSPSRKSLEERLFGASSPDLSDSREGNFITE